MSAKKFAGTVISVSLEIIFAALVIIFIYNFGLKAYSFGFSVFAEQSIASEPGRDVNVTIDANASTYEIGELLVEKGLIKDAKLFYVQMKLSALSNDINSGKYTLNTSMTAEDMINIITVDAEAEADDETDEE
ncbi:MAG: endolytic transglycosylase MltG [Lachnotalea sp.]